MKKEPNKRLKNIIIIISIFALIFGSFFCAFNFIFPVRYKDIILEECEKYSVDSALVFSLINAESGFDKNAESHKGACGLMQLMPQTAKFVCENLGEEFDKEKLFEPETNIKYGVFYLNYLLEKFDAVETAICAYNAGETVVREWLKNSDYSPDGKNLVIVPYKETKNYLKKINLYFKVYKKIV